MLDKESEESYPPKLTIPKKIKFRRAYTIEQIRGNHQWGDPFVKCPECNYMLFVKVEFDDIITKTLIRCPNCDSEFKVYSQLLFMEKI